MRRGSTDNATAIGELAGRTTVRHDWELTLATLQGAAAEEPRCARCPYGRRPWWVGDCESST